MDKKRVIKNKYDFSGEKVLFWMDRIKNFVDDDFSDFPVSIELSPSSFCNLNCMWCIDKRWRDNISGFIDVDILLDRMREIYKNGTRGIVFRTDRNFAR